MNSSNILRRFLHPVGCEGDLRDRAQTLVRRQGAPLAQFLSLHFFQAGVGHDRFVHRFVCSTVWDIFAIRPQKRKRPPGFLLMAVIYVGDDLLSHTLSRAVQSALRGLTSVFGMGTGVSPAVRSPASLTWALGRTARSQASFHAGPLRRSCKELSSGSLEPQIPRRAKPSPG